MSLRALVIGLVCVLALSAAAPYSIWILGSSEITWSHFPIAAGVPFIAVVLANAAVRRLSRGWALRPGELATVVIMALVASGIPVFLAGLILAIPSSPYYGATSTNRWDDYIQPFLPGWAVPSPSGDAMRHFYEGLPSGGAIPWDAWLGPLAWWFSLIAGVYTVCLCVVVILRRQWMDRERLVFPVMEVPRLLVEEARDSCLPDVMRTLAFWVGCAIPALMMAYNTLGWFEPAFAPVGLHRGSSIELIHGLPRLPVVLYFPVVGFVYLVSTSVSFSVWFFYLLALLGTGLLQWAAMGTRPDPYVYGSLSATSWVSTGAFVAMVFLGLWMSRGHLMEVARRAITGTGIDDRGEILSYRQALLGLAAGLVFVTGWLCASGMELGIALLFVAAALVIYLGITRLVVQSGLHYITAPTNPQAITLACSGSFVSPYSLVSLALSYAWIGDIQSTFMPAAAHAAKLNDVCRLRRSLIVPIALAVLAAFITSLWVMLELCYEHGAVNLRSGWFRPTTGAGAMAFDPIVRLIADPQGTDLRKLGFAVVGALLYIALAALHYRHHWWPLHPVGLTVASVWMVEQIVVSVFVGWACRAVILRLGGIGMFRRARPFFIGLVVGFFMGIGFSFAVDWIWFAGQGHPILHG